MSRTQYPGGAAYLTWNGLTHRAAKDFKIEDDPKTFKAGMLTRGQDFDERLEDLMSKCSFQPLAFGASIEAQFAALLPYNDLGLMGTLIFPSDDLPLVILQRDGKSVTYPAAQLTKMPKLAFGPNKPLFGDIELTMLLAGGSLVGDAASHDTVAAASYSEPATDPADQLYDRYTLTLTPAAGGDPFTIEVDKDGIEFTPVIELEPVKPAMEATVNFRIKNISATLDFTPLDMDIDTFYATFFPMQGANVALGGSIRSAGHSVVIAGSAVGKAQLTIPLVSRNKASGPQYSNTNGRLQKVSLVAMQAISEGSYLPLFTPGVIPAP